jgi:hypothetical protein
MELLIKLIDGKEDSVQKRIYENSFSVLEGFGEYINKKSSFFNSLKISNFTVGFIILILLHSKKKLELHKEKEKSKTTRVRIKPSVVTTFTELFSQNSKFKDSLIEFFKLQQEMF